MTESWIPVCPPDEIEVGAAKVVKGERDGARYQIVVFRGEGERFDAVDNLCPHEGYPLVQGYVKDCVLTCAWHNFKFKLSDGECIKGDEAVAVYPTRVQDGVVEVQLRSSEKAADVPKTFASLREGLERGQLGRVTRDVVRLLQAQVSPEMLLLAAARFDAERAEWGTNHAQAVAADMLGELPRFPGLEAALPIMQAMESASDPNERRGLRELAAPVAPTGDAAAVGAELRALIEAEDHPRAEALLRGALAAGHGREEVEPWFFALCCDHFIGFGHPLIYVTKVFELLERVGFDHAEHLLPSLLYRIVNSTREDTLPPMEYVEGHFEAHAAKFEAWNANTGELAGSEALLAAILDGNKHDACSAVTDALDQGAAPLAVLDVLARAASERMLRFDIELGNSNEIQEGWLDLTHALTYSHASRVTFERFDDPCRLRLLFYIAHFVQRTRPLDLEQRVELPSLSSSTPDEIEAAVVAKHTDLAVALVQHFLGNGGDAKALQDRFMDYVYSDKLVRPIVVAHGLKTCLAAFAELEALGGDPTPVLAFTRFAASPIRERAISRTVHEAIRFLRDGYPPKRLTT